MPAIVYEIFPITLHEGRLVLLQREHGDGPAPWYIPCDLGLHPSHAVSGAVEAHVGPLFDPQTSVLHSTSWRYESGPEGEGRIVLTYLAVFPPGRWDGRSMPGGRIIGHPVAALTTTREEACQPTKPVTVEQVLAHALEHLAMLVEVDPAVRAALSPAWDDALHARRPLPAGYPRAWA